MNWFGLNLGVFLHFANPVALRQYFSILHLRFVPYCSSEFAFLKPGMFKLSLLSLYNLALPKDQNFSIICDLKLFYDLSRFLDLFAYIDFIALFFVDCSFHSKFFVFSIHIIVL